jgi:hypothetical protein
MSNPQLALWLYIAILVITFMFSPKWGNLTGELSSGVNAKKGA